MNCTLYELAKQAGLTDEHIKADAVLLMAGTADIDILSNIANPMMVLANNSISYTLPNNNPKSEVSFYKINVDRIVGQE